MGYGPLIKYGLIVVAFLTFCAGLILYGENRRQLEWDASVAEQQMATGENIVKNAQNTARIESEFQRQLDAQANRVRVVNKEVKVYVESPTEKCLVSPEFERVFDALSRMHEPSADSLPAAPDPTGAAAVVPRAPLTDAAILAAYQLAVVELFNLWDTYAALVEWVRSSRAIAAEGAGR